MSFRTSTQNIEHEAHGLRTVVRRVPDTCCSLRSAIESRQETIEKLRNAPCTAKDATRSDRSAIRKGWIAIWNGWIAIWSDWIAICNGRTPAPGLRRAIRSGQGSLESLSSALDGG